MRAVDPPRFAAIFRPPAPVAELVDAPDSKSGNGNIVLVRVRPGAPNLKTLWLRKRFLLLPLRPTCRAADRTVLRSGRQLGPDAATPVTLAIAPRPQLRNAWRRGDTVGVIRSLLRPRRSRLHWGGLRIARNAPYIGRSPYITAGARGTDDRK